MKDFESAKASVDANISQNGNQDISGSRLNSVLTDMLEATEQEVDKKQDKLVSGGNIKTINGQSILGRGNITIQGGEGGGSGEGGLQYSIERTLYGADGGELTEEQRAYNAETYRIAAEGGFVTMNMDGFLCPIYEFSISDDPKYVSLSVSFVMSGIVVDTECRIYEDGNVELGNVGMNPNILYLDNPLSFKTFFASSVFYQRRALLYTEYGFASVNLISRPIEFGGRMIVLINATAMDISTSLMVDYNTGEVILAEDKTLGGVDKAYVDEQIAKVSGGSSVLRVWYNDENTDEQIEENIQVYNRLINYEAVCVLVSIETSRDSSMEYYSYPMDSFYVKDGVVHIWAHDVFLEVKSLVREDYHFLLYSDGSWGIG